MDTNETNERNIVTLIPSPFWFRVCICYASFCGIVFTIIQFLLDHFDRTSQIFFISRYIFVDSLQQGGLSSLLLIKEY